MGTTHGSGWEITDGKEAIMRNRYITGIFLLMLAMSASPVSAASQEPVVVGVPLPLTGKFQEFGVMMKNSFEMAEESINKNGGINGKPLQLVFADDEGKEDSAAKVVSRLVDARAVLLVGGYASNPTYQIAKTAEKKNMPFLVCTASADRITQKGWRNTFRLSPPISEYTKGLEDFWVKNFQPKSMAIIYENSMFGTDGALRMMEFCQSRAIEIRTQINYDKTRTDPAYFRSMIAPLTEDPPDVIYMVSYLEDAVTLVKEIRALKIRSLVCGGAGGYTLEEFVRRAGDAANHVLTAALWSEHVQYPGAKEYFARYSERYGRYPDYHGAEAYSALLVAADALSRAKSFSSQDIRAALNDTYMKTPFGPVKFYSYDGFERQNSVNTLVLEIIDGRFQTIWPPEMASARFVLPEK
jgi:branched-chain amino acid transport system substrate-binding protein